MLVFVGAVLRERARDMRRGEVHRGWKGTMAAKMPVKQESGATRLPLLVAAVAALVIAIVATALVMQRQDEGAPAPASQAPTVSGPGTPTLGPDTGTPSSPDPAGKVPASPSEVEDVAGLRDPGALKPSSSVTATEDGQVIENLDVTGVINVKADDVTIRNVRLKSGSSSFGINVQRGTEGTLIEHVDVEMGVGGNTANAAIGGSGGSAPESASEPGDNVTVRFSRLHGNADGIKAAHYGLYEFNYITMRRSDGSKKHIDGIQGSGSSHWTARYNWIDQAYSAGHNAAIFLQSYTGKVDRQVVNVVLVNNWVNGGVYTLHFEDGKKEPGPFLEQVVVRDNVFFRDYKYGVYQPEGPGITGNGGVWADTGQAVPEGAIKS